jgi:hypothetical protein
VIFGVHLCDQSEICMETFFSIVAAQLNTAVLFSVVVWTVPKCSHQQDGNHVMMLLRFSECNTVLYAVKLTSIGIDFYSGIIRLI